MGIRPPADLPVEAWVEEHVRLGSWARSPRLRLGVTPWMVRPLRELAEGETRIVVLRWPTGSGKSTFFEGLVPWIVSEDPGPLQCSFKTDEQARRWVETRMVPVLERTDATKGILEGTHRHKKRKLELLLPHMFVLFGGANMTRLQDVSIQWVLGQEVWDWEPGMIGEALARHHYRWNRRAVFCGQGGTEGSEFAELDGTCAQWEYGFRCSSCGEVRRYWPAGEDVAECFRRRMGWDEELATAEEVDWEALGKTVVLRCDCGAEYADEVEVRRELAMSFADYVAVGNAHTPRSMGFSLPRMAVWWVEWAEVVAEFLQAERALARGERDLWRQFTQKSAARHYAEGSDAPEVVRGEYSREEYWPEKDEQGNYEAAPRWVDEAFRFLTVDVQKRHFWVVVRAWRMGGDSRLVWEGQVSTIEGVRDLQRMMGVENWAVGIDGRYRPDLVAEWQVRFAGKGGPKDVWTMLMGEDNDGYPSRVVTVEGGKRVEVRVLKPYSEWVRGRTPKGVPYRFIKLSNLRMKDTLSGLIESEEVVFDVPADASEHYARHMKAEVRREKRPGKPIWEKVKPHYRNDLWDCEVMQVGMAALKRVLRVEVVRESEGKEA